MATTKKRKAPSTSKVYLVKNHITFLPDKLGAGVSWEPGDIVESFPKGCNVAHWVKRGDVEKVKSDKADELSEDLVDEEEGEEEEEVEEEAADTEVEAEAPEEVVLNPEEEEEVLVDGEPASEDGEVTNA